MNIGWECPVCHKGCAPHAEKCGHCAELKLVYRDPVPLVYGSGILPSQRELPVTADPLRIGDRQNDPYETCLGIAT